MPIEITAVFNDRKEGAMGALIGLVVLALDIIAIVDIAKGAFSTGKKVLWIVLVLVFPLVGMAVYFLVGKKQ
jgi:hypothetical protein